MQSTLMRTEIRWMLRRDLKAVVEIDRLSFDIGWDAETFLACLRQRNCIGVVAEVGDTIVGEMIYELNKHAIDILTFAVHPDFRGLGFGSQMMNKLKHKLWKQRRSTLRYIASEWNEDAHLFLRACGFEAVAVAKDWYSHPWHGDEDGYVFEYEVE